MGVTPEEETTESAAALDEAAASLVTLWSLAHNAPDVPVPATQLRVLFILERGPVNVSNLAAELDALVSSASRLCDRLEAAGLLLRDHGQDRRQVSVRLSTDGQALLDRLRVRRRDDLGRVLEGMSSPARAALIWGLTQFQESVRAQSGADADTDAGSPGSAGKSFSLPA